MDKGYSVSIMDMLDFGGDCPKTLQLFVSCAWPKCYREGTSASLKGLGVVNLTISCFVNKPSNRPRDVNNMQRRFCRGWEIHNQGKYCLPTILWKVAATISRGVSFRICIGDSSTMSDKSAPWNPSSWRRKVQWLLALSFCVSCNRGTIAAYSEQIKIEDIWYTNRWHVLVSLVLHIL
jgi:hypothetical protein